MTYDDLLRAWDARLRAKHYLPHTEEYKRGMREWTRTISALPGKGKLEWTPHPGGFEPNGVQGYDCLVMGVMFLEWYETPPPVVKLPYHTLVRVPK